MKKKYEKLPLGILLTSVTAAFLSVIARSLLTLSALDPTYGVYEHSNVMPTIYHIALTIILIVLAGTAVAKAPLREPDYVRPHCDFTLFASCVCVFLLVAEMLLTLYGVVVNNSSLSTLDILELCFAVPSALYFLGLVRSQSKSSALLMLTSLFPIAWCATCLIRIYFDTTILQVSPNKIMGELAFLSAMVYFLSEARAQLAAINHKLYLASAVVAPVLLMTSAVPNLLFSERLSIGTSDSFMHYAIEAALALFIWARLGAYAKVEYAEE